MDTPEITARDPETAWNLSAWVDSVHRIISFTPQKDFRKLNFSSYQEMLSYVVKLGFEGYGIL